MIGFFICQCYNPQYMTFKSINKTPEPLSIIFLSFHLDWILNYFDTLFFLEIGSLPQNLLLEIFCKLEISHPTSIIDV